MSRKNNYDKHGIEKLREDAPLFIPGKWSTPAIKVKLKNTIISKYTDKDFTIGKIGNEYIIHFDGLSNKDIKDINNIIYEDLINE